MKNTKIIFKAAVKSFLTLAMFCALWGGVFGAKARAVNAPLAQDSQIKPGDKACLSDIALGDPLVDATSSDSFKYWYRSTAGRQKPRYELRPMARKLLLKILWPGLKVSGVDKRGKGWYKAAAVVIKGGANPGEKARTIQRGANTLLRDEGRSLAVDWQVLYFEKARFKKKGIFGCKKKYDKY